MAPKLPSRAEIGHPKPKIAVFPPYLGPGVALGKTLWHIQSTLEWESPRKNGGKLNSEILGGGPLNSYPYLGSPNSGTGAHI